MGVPIITGAGAQLSAKAARLAEVIKDFDDTLELQWIPPVERNALGIDYEPYRIVQFHPNYEPYAVMWLREDQLDERVLARLFQARSGNALSDLEAEEAARVAFQLKEKLEEQEEAREIAMWALKSPKTVKHNGVVYR